MKNFIKTCGVILCSMLLAFGIFYADKKQYSYAEAVESSVVQFGLDELAGGYQQDGTTRTASEGKGYSYTVAKNGRFGFSGPYENVEVITKINFSEIASHTWTGFTMRAQGDALSTMDSASWTNKGYRFMWGFNGTYGFYVGDTTVVEYGAWGPLPAPTVGADYTVSFKTANIHDAEAGTTVCHIVVAINGTTFVDHTTTEEAIAGGWFNITSGGTAFTATGDRFAAQEGINLVDVSNPTTSANFPGATIAEDGTVTSSGGSYSGVGYVFGIDSAYAIKTQFKPTSYTNTDSSLKITLGAKKSNTRAMARYNTISADWGWADSGYTVSWAAGGKGFVARSATTKSSTTGLPTYELNKTYDILAGYKPYPDGSNLVYLMVDNKLVLSYLDLKTADNTPLVPTTSGTPGSFTTYSLIVAYTCAADIIPYPKATYSTDTLIKKDLGIPTTAEGVVVDANAQITNFNGSIVGKYAMAEKSSSIKFKANFTTTGSNIVFQTRAQGTLDTPWGGGWTNRGYSIYLHSSGQVTYLKNKTTVCEGWATGGFSLPANTDIIIEVGAINISDNIVRFFVYVNDTLVLNFVDTTAASNEVGSFSIFSSGYAGSLTQVGYSIPTLATSAVDNAAKVNDTITLSYDVDGKDASDTVVYYVDETASTATATITEDTLVPMTEGTLVVGVKVNDIYSDTISLTIEEQTKALVIDLPTQPVVVGGQKVTVDGKLSDDSTIATKVFSIENLTGKATIDETTGEITAIAAGSVNVFVTINGIKSQAYLISITPIIEVGNTLAMAVGQTRNLSYSSNCDLPQETILVSYELIAGDEYVDLNTTTGEITAVAIGTFTVRVTLVGQTFSAVSEVVTIPVEAPIVVLHGVKDIVVGETIELAPTINDGITVNSYSIVATTGGEHITITGKKIKGKSAGRVWIKAIVNGFESLEHEFAVEELVATIIAPNNLPIGESTTMSVMFNSAVYTPNTVVFNIVSGAKYATLEGNTLTALTKHGVVKVKATIDNKYTAEIEITIVKIAPVGISDNQTVFIGSSVNISYIYYGSDPVTSVQYKIVSGGSHATLTTLPLQEGETVADTKALLEVKSKGTIKLQIIVNGDVKETIAINARKQVISRTNPIVWLSVLGGVVALAAIATPTTIVLVRKHKKGKNPKGTDPDNNGKKSKSKKNDKEPKSKKEDFERRKKELKAELENQKEPLSRNTKTNVEEQIQEVDGSQENTKEESAEKVEEAKPEKKTKKSSTKKETNKKTDSKPTKAEPKPKKETTEPKQDKTKQTKNKKTNKKG